MNVVSEGLKERVPSERKNIIALLVIAPYRLRLESKVL